jgi:YegS/Rv2252/BmrU family lipid kinase
MGIQDDFWYIVKTLNENDYEVQVQMTLKHQHAIEIAKNAHDVDVIICSGGDGTLNHVVSGLVEGNKHIPIGYIPSGSTNDYARTLHLSMDAAAALNEILEGDGFALDVGAFDNKAHFVYIASFGLFSAASYNTPQEIKNEFGSIAYLFNGLVDIVNTKPYHVKMRANGEEIEGDYILGMVSNTLSIAGIMKLDPNEVDLSDGLFEILLVKKPTTLNDYNDMLNALRTKNFSNKNVFSYVKASEVEFQFNETLTWSLDGEETKADKIVCIKNLQKRIQIIKYS